MPFKPASNYYKQRHETGYLAQNSVTSVSNFKPYVPKLDGESILRRCRIYDRQYAEVGHIIQDGTKNFRVMFYEIVRLSDYRKRSMCFSSPGELTRFIEAEIPQAKINGW